MLLKTSTESVMGEYCGPLFADYHIFALDTGFGSKTGDTDELERKLEHYLEENAGAIKNESIRVTSVRKLMDESGEQFFEQAAAYEKYVVAEDVVKEIYDRIKNLGDQSTVTKVMEKKMGIEDELSVIDKYTLDLMKLIDGVNLTLGAKTSSLLGYSVEDDFIKRFFIGDITMSNAGINNPSVYEKLKDKYTDPLEKLEIYREKLTEHLKKQKENEKDMMELKAAEEKERMIVQALDLKREEQEKNDDEKEQLLEEIEKYNEKIAAASSIKNKKKAKKEIKKYEDMKVLAEERLNSVGEHGAELLREISELEADAASAGEEVSRISLKMGEELNILARQSEECNTLAMELEYLFTMTLYMLESVSDIVENVAEKQAAVRPLVEEYEELLRLFGPALSKDIKDGFEESLDYMRAYVGMGGGRIKTTDFDSIKRTADYDRELLDQVDTEAFFALVEGTSTETEERLKKLDGIPEKIAGFSYSGFSFDYSEIKESMLENKLVEEFENNVAEGYLSLFLKPGTKLSTNSLISELLPSSWFEVMQNDDGEMMDIAGTAEDKGGGQMLSEADDGSGISDLADILGEGLENMTEKLMAALYMRHHFKSFTDKSVTGDTILDYEIEYILSGYETDMANLSAAATKIMLLRLVLCSVYTMTDKSTKAEAQVLATSIMGFTGLPFLVTIVKYLILFLWAAAQAVIETAAIMRGKKVPIITNDDSFCLTLAELPLFASLVDEKADSFKESQVYLDYNDYMLVLLLLQGEKNQTARAMDVIQENIRYKYDEDFLMSNAITAFSCTGMFSVPVRYLSFAGKLFEGGDGYSISASDMVSY